MSPLTNSVFNLKTIQLNDLKNNSRRRVRYFLFLIRGDNAIIRRDKTLYPRDFAAGSNLRINLPTPPSENPIPDISIFLFIKNFVFPELNSSNIYTLSTFSVPTKKKLIQEKMF